VGIGHEGRGDFKEWEVVFVRIPSAGGQTSRAWVLLQIDETD
jgi:hypothetical protein